MSEKGQLNGFDEWFWTFTGCPISSFSHKTCNWCFWTFFNGLIWSPFNAKHLCTYFDMLSVALIVRGGLIAVHAVLSGNIDYSMLENDSASDNAAQLFNPPRFSKSPDQALLSQTLKRFPGTTWTFCDARNGAQSCWNGGSDIHDIISSPKLTFAVGPGKASAKKLSRTSIQCTLCIHRT